MFHWRNLLTFFILSISSYAFFIEWQRTEVCLFLGAVVILTYTSHFFRSYLPLFFTFLGGFFTLLIAYEWNSSLPVFLQRLIWPLDFMIAALVAYTCHFLVSRKDKLSLNWKLSFPKKALLSIAIINIPAIFVLTWYFSVHPGVVKQFPMPSLPSWGYPFFILLVALVNGFREEIFFRGVLQEASNKSLPPALIVAIQSLSFGFIHYTNSFPQGWLGVFLTALWGGAIAIQYQIFRSIILAWLTHSLADAIMFTIILFLKP